MGLRRLGWALPNRITKPALLPRHTPRHAPRQGYRIKDRTAPTCLTRSRKTRKQPRFLLSHFPRCFQGFRRNGAGSFGKSDIDNIGRTDDQGPTNLRGFPHNYRRFLNPLTHEENRSEATRANSMRSCHRAVPEILGAGDEWKGCQSFWAQHCHGTTNPPNCLCRRRC